MTIRKCLLRPAGAHIELHGAFVRSAPSAITASMGDKTIALKKSGYAPWERKICVTGGKIQISGELQASEVTQTRPDESLSQIVSAVMTHG
jgi:hypothetical protein